MYTYAGKIYLNTQKFYAYIFMTSYFNGIQFETWILHTPFVLMCKRNYSSLFVFKEDEQLN